jgi:DNA-binding MarR family transcriptional regulator
LALVRNWSFVLDGRMVRTRKPDPLEKEDRIVALEKQVADLGRQLTRLKSSSKGEITLRSLSHDEARSEILRLFRTGETLYYSDIVGRLGIDIDDVVEICRELEAEGKIETIDDAA